MIDHHDEVVLNQFSLRWARVICGRICAAVALVSIVLLVAAPLRVLQGAASLALSIATFSPQAVDTTLFAEPYHTALRPIESVLLTWPWLWPLLGALSFALLDERPPVVAFRYLPRWRVALLALLLAAALVAGLRLRVAPLLERDTAVAWRVDYDEGVYVSFARSWPQGNLPYRDMWMSHPPTGIAVLVPVATLSPTGEDALANTRRVNALFDLVAGALLLWVGWQLGGATAGVLAASLYFLDSLAGRNATHVWLETGVNLWSVAALGCALHGLRHERLRWLVVAGGLAVLAATTKYTGMALLVALVAALAGSRKWRACGAVLLGALGCIGVYAALMLPLGWRELVQQTLVAQLLRPQDNVDLTKRLDIVFGGVTSLPTTVAAALGTCALLLRRPHFTVGWAITLMWFAASLALVASGPSFYVHYVTQLVPALALLAGGIAAERSVQSGKEWARQGDKETRRQADQKTKLLLSSFATVGKPLFGLTLALLFVPLVVTQQVLLPPAPLSRDWVESGRVIDEQVPATAPLLSFDAMYNLLGNRPFARAPDGRLLIDSYMHLRWLGIDWRSVSWLEMANAVLRRSPLPPAAEQDAVLVMLRAAPYAAFNEFRTVQTKEQVVTLAGNFRATTLGIGTLYSRSPTPRHFQAETIRMRGVLLPSVAKAGATLPIAMFWQKPAPESRQPFVSLQLVDADDVKYGQYDKPVGPAEAGLGAWPVGPNTYQDDILLPVAPETPPGIYRLLMVIYDPAANTRWQLRGDDGQPLGEIIELQQVTVEP